ncbi:CHC2 zinc finger domain-containing protein [Actinoplanes sp. CA-054009]
MRCPFHEDSRSSAIVDTVDQWFKCYGCGAMGNTFSLVMWKEGLDFRSTVEFLKGIPGVGNTGLSGPAKGKRGGRRRANLSDETPAPVRGQRTIFQARIRRRPSTGA